jgi:hypothetical protein
MSSEEDYSQLASHSIQLADRILPNTARDHFIAMAQYWMKLARRANADALSSQDAGNAQPLSSKRNVQT